ncbi:hypothetical protein RJ639_022585, partial [Escallonia herrerae]
MKEMENTPNREDGQLGVPQVLSSLPNWVDLLHTCLEAVQTLVSMAKMVKAKIKRRNIEALVDVGATTNFIDLGAVKQLGLSIVADKSMIQPVNSWSKCIHGMVEDSDIEFGDWKGHATLTMLDTADHDVMLGMDFMRDAHAIP